MIAKSGGATAEVTIDLGSPVTVNDPDLTRRMIPTCRAWTAAVLILIAAAPLCFDTASAAQPDRIWLAEAPAGATIDDAWRAGAEVFDRFPGRFVLGDAASADALAAED